MGILNYLNVNDFGTFWQKHAFPRHDVKNNRFSIDLIIACNLVRLHLSVVFNLHVCVPHQLFITRVYG